MAKNVFQSVKRSKIPRANFNLSHEVKLSAKLGQLLPVLCEEVVPGDKWHISSETMVRLAPLISPVMHRMNVYMHYFYVPNRLIWSGWEKFITGDQATTIPVLNTTGQSSIFNTGNLGDYLGLPTHLSTTNNFPFSQLPFRAFWKIWNEYYRDQNLQTEKNVEALASADFVNIPYRAWEKDYFTSCLPWAQKGASVNIPLSDIDYKDPAQLTDAAASGDYDAKITDSDGSGSNNVIGSSIGLTGTHDLTIKNIDSVNVDINEFRTAHRVQRWLEKNARSGSRYVEHLMAHFGVRSSDHRLDRPEYLGGGKQPITISEIANTSSTATEAQGDLAGHGISVGSSNKASKYFEEHGFVIGVLSVLPNTAYSQGLPKKFSRSINHDFYFPEFARLGEQEVLNKELYVDESTDDDEVFGYQSRYAEYKYKPSSIHGEFKDSLEFYHMSRKFSGTPPLHEDFVTTELEAFPLQQRIFATGKDAPFWVQIYHNIIAKRPMPYHSDPTI